jgi:hypothetical protein
MEIEFPGKIETIDVDAIEKFGQLFLLLILLDPFYMTISEVRKKSVKNVFENESVEKRIIEAVSRTNRGIFDSWEFIFEMTTDDLLSLSLYFSDFEKSFDFPIEVLDQYRQKGEFSEVSSGNFDRIRKMYEKIDMGSKRGRRPRTEFEEDMRVARFGSIAGILCAGIGKIETIDSLEHVYEQTASLCGEMVGDASVKKACFENKSSQGAKFRTLIQEISTILFDKLPPDERLPLPRPVEIYMVLFLATTLYDYRFWTGRDAENGIPLLAPPLS